MSPEEIDHALHLMNAATLARAVEQLRRERDEARAALAEAVDRARKGGHRPYARRDETKWPGDYGAARWSPAYWCNTGPCDPDECGLEAFLKRADAALAAAGKDG